MTDDNEITIIPGENLPEQNKSPYAHRDFPVSIDTQENVEKLIDRFLMDTHNISASSKKRYKDSLKIYFKWVRERSFDLKEITRTELIMYYEWLSAQKSPRTGDTFSDYTVGTYFIAVKLFYGWANSMGLMMNPAGGIKIKKKSHKFRRKPLNAEQMEKLLAHFKDKSLRDYAIISVMYYCGMRTIEISRLDFGDISTVDGVRQILVMGKGKTSKDDWVKLNDKPYAAITEYIASRGAVDKNDPMFISESAFASKSGQRLHKATISRIAKSGLKAIGLDERVYTAHGIRHSAATNAIRKGATISQVKEMLRHVDEKTTMAYIYTIKDEERRNNKSAEDFL